MTRRQRQRITHVGAGLCFGLCSVLACAGTKDKANTSPTYEPPSDPSAKVSVQSAATPNRNESSSDPGQGRGWDLMSKVEDCDVAVCPGSAPDALIEAIRSHAAEARACYETALKQTPTLSGRMSLQLRIRHDGTSCQVRVLQNELSDNKTLMPCVRGVLEVNYPKPQSGCVELVLPLRFVPEFVDAGSET